MLESGDLPLLLTLAPTVPSAAECVHVLCFSGGLHRVLLQAPPSATPLGAAAAGAPPPLPPPSGAASAAAPSHAAAEFLRALVGMLAPLSEVRAVTVSQSLSPHHHHERERR